MVGLKVRYEVISETVMIERKHYYVEAENYEEAKREALDSIPKFTNQWIHVAEGIVSVSGIFPQPPIEKSEH